MYKALRGRFFAYKHTAAYRRVKPLVRGNADIVAKRGVNAFHPRHLRRVEYKHKTVLAAKVGHLFNIVGVGGNVRGGGADKRRRIF